VTALTPLQFSGIVGTELLTQPNRFIRDDDSPFDSYRVATSTVSLGNLSVAEIFLEHRIRYLGGDDVALLRALPNVFCHTVRVFGRYEKQLSAIRGDTLELQFFILIHELAHFFKVPGFQAADAGIDAQKGHNDDVWQHCAKTLKAAAGKGPFS
jgi:hypothetical protein